MTSLKIVVAVAALCASFGALATGVLIPVNFSGATDASGHLVAEAYKEQSTCVIWSLPAAIIPAMPYEIYTNGFQTPTGGISVLIPTLSISQQTGWRMPTLNEALALYSSLSDIRRGTVATPAGFVEPARGPFWTANVNGAQAAAIDTRTGYTQWYSRTFTAVRTWAVMTADCR